MCKSCVVYECKCDECGATYIGKTKRTLKIRKQEHYEALTKPNRFSSIANHVLETGHDNVFDFKIIDHGNNDFQLLIKEALHIRDKKPSLNENLEINLRLY